MPNGRKKKRIKYKKNNINISIYICGVETKITETNIFLKRNRIVTKIFSVISVVMELPNQKHLMCDTNGECDKEYIELRSNRNIICNYEHTSCSHIRVRHITPRCTYSSFNGILSA